MRQGPSLHGEENRLNIQLWHLLWKSRSSDS